MPIMQSSTPYAPQPRHKSNPERLSQHRPNAERFHIQSPMLDLPLYMQRLAMDPAVYESCYTCRSRRIQCDQTGMPCAKCAKAGLECFDKRPFRWVKGVAIRGKMQGRSYESKGTSSATNSDSTLAKSRRSVVKSSPERVEKVKSDRGMSRMDFECDVHEWTSDIDWIDPRFEFSSGNPMDDPRSVCRQLGSEIPLLH